MSGGNIYSTRNPTWFLAVAGVAMKVLKQEHYKFAVIGLEFVHVVIVTVRKEINW